MVTGYLLCDVINALAGRRFMAGGELHTLSALSQCMVHKMRDATGDSGEVHTPRPVVCSWSPSPTRVG